MTFFLRFTFICAVFLVVAYTLALCALHGVNVPVLEALNVR